MLEQSVIDYENKIIGNRVYFDSGEFSVGAGAKLAVRMFG